LIPAKAPVKNPSPHRLCIPENLGNWAVWAIAAKAKAEKNQVVSLALLVVFLRLIMVKTSRA
jgi:hypothetical protein